MGVLINVNHQRMCGCIMTRLKIFLPPDELEFIKS